MIGIFCINDNKIISKKIKWEKGKETGNYRYKFLHFIKFKDIDVDKVLKGRVVYNVCEKSYEILVSKEIIKSKKYQSLILDEFKINKNYRFIIDQYMQNSKRAEILFFKVNDIVRKVDPFHIAWVSFDEYYPEVNDITSKLLKEKEDKFHIVKEVFDKWFFEDERKINEYKKIAKEIKKLNFT